MKEALQMIKDKVKELYIFVLEDGWVILNKVNLMVMGFLQITVEYKLEVFGKMEFSKFDKYKTNLLKHFP